MYHVFALRENTERPVTVEQGTNIVVGTDAVRIRQAVAQLLDGRRKTGRVPESWDGHAAERIVRVLLGEVAVTEHWCVVPIENEVMTQ